MPENIKSGSASPVTNYNPVATDQFWTSKHFTLFPFTNKFY